MNRELIGQFMDRSGSRLQGSDQFSIIILSFPSHEPAGHLIDLHHAPDSLVVMELCLDPLAHVFRPSGVHQFP
jgi:hypothetical protein